MFGEQNMKAACVIPSTHQADYPRCFSDNQPTRVDPVSSVCSQCTFVGPPSSQISPVFKVLKTELNKLLGNPYNVLHVVAVRAPPETKIQ